jgi:hypothetical protein
MKFSFIEVKMDRNQSQNRNCDGNCNSGSKASNKAKDMFNVRMLTSNFHLIFVFPSLCRRPAEVTLKMQRSVGRKLIIKPPKEITKGFIPLKLKSGLIITI